VAKARKGSRRAASASTRKASARKKTTKKRAAAPAKGGHDLGPLKKQISAHIAKLSSRETTDTRVQDALASLQRVQSELTAACNPTMVVG
jgi:hypothetical protein